MEIEQFVPKIVGVAALDGGTHHDSGTPCFPLRRCNVVHCIFCSKWLQFTEAR